MKKIINDSFAIYKNKTYSVTFRSGQVILRSFDEADLEDDFIEIVKPDRNIVCYKIVSKLELTELYDITTTAIYEGVEFGIRQEKEGMLYITTGSTTGMGAIIEKFKMVQFDRGEYGMWVKIEDVELKVRKKNVVIK